MNGRCVLIEAGRIPSQTRKEEINKLIKDFDSESQLAILAELVDEFLEQSRMQSSGKIDEVHKKAEKGQGND